MKSKSKKVAIGIAALLSVAFCVTGAVLSTERSSVQADDTSIGLAVDTLGNLEWDSVDGAASYTWQYAYGDVTSEIGKTQTPSVNVNEVLKGAVKAGETTVKFTVTPEGGEAITYDHTITGYTDYTGETHDISEFMKVEKSSIHERAKNTFDIIYEKNTMFTWGMNIDVPIGVTNKADRIMIKLGGVPRTNETTGALNYKGSIDNTARHCISVYDDNWAIRKSNGSNDTKTHTTTVDFNTNYYFELAVTDHYDVSGTQVNGEKVYLAMYTADESGAKTLVHTETWERPTTQIKTGDVAQWLEGNTISLDFCLYSEGGVYYTDNAGNYSTSAVTGYDKVMVCTKALLFSGDPSYKDDNVEDLYGGSKVKAYTLTPDGTIDMNFYIQLSDTHKAHIENLQLKLVCGSETRNVPFPAACVGDGWVNGLYKFTYPVAAKEIDSEISLQLMIDEGVVGNTVSYSVRDYINSVQAADVSETYTQKLKDIVTALEDYCEAAAKFHGVENAAIADTSRIETVDNTVFNDYGATVVGENAPQIAITLLTESTTTLRIYVGTAEKPTIKANSVELEVKQAENGYYYADLTGIDAFSLAKPQTFVINNTITVTCSALTYGKFMDTTNADLVNVMKALYLYSQAATAYKA